MSSVEYCFECGEPTGKAGPCEDSLYCPDCDAGPFCNTCFREHEVEQKTRIFSLLGESPEVAREYAEKLIDSQYEGLSNPSRIYIQRMREAIRKWADVEAGPSDEYVERTVEEFYFKHNRPPYRLLLHEGIEVVFSGFSHSEELLLEATITKIMGETVS